MIKKSILIIEDSEHYRFYLKELLSPRYNILTAKTGQEALNLLKEIVPSCILSDYCLPDMEGLDFWKNLRQNIVLEKIPIIILSAHTDGETRSQLLNIGVDRCLQKPIDGGELLSIITMTFQRTLENLNANALTHLPGNHEIYKRLHQILKHPEYSVAYIDIDNFKTYNDIYDFERGDKVILDTSKILVKSINPVKSKYAFVGHIGGDDFLIVVKDSSIVLVCHRIMLSFSQQYPKWYNKEDITRGYFFTEDRSGVKCKIPLLSLSIAIVGLEQRQITHIGQISEIGTELKKYAKTIPGNTWVRDKRKGGDAI